MKQLALNLAESVFDCILRKLKCLTNSIENINEYTHTLAEVLQRNINFEMYAKINSQTRLKLAEKLADRLISRMHSYHASYYYELVTLVADVRTFQVAKGPNYNKSGTLEGLGVCSISLPAGLFGNKDALVRELLKVFRSINLFLDFPQQWQFINNDNLTLFSRLPQDISRMTGSYYMNQDLTSLIPTPK